MLCNSLHEEEAVKTKVARQVLFDSAGCFQVMTRAPTVHILRILAAILSVDTSANHTIAAGMVPQLWSAVLGILQHGAAAAKLSVVRLTTLSCNHLKANLCVGLTVCIFKCSFACTVRPLFAMAIQMEGCLI